MLDKASVGYSGVDSISAVRETAEWSIAKSALAAAEIDPLKIKGPNESKYTADGLSMTHEGSLNGVERQVNSVTDQDLMLNLRDWE